MELVSHLGTNIPIKNVVNQKMFLPEIKSEPTEDISILIKLDNHSDLYLCECGQASKLTVKDCQQIAVIFISHTHIDHFINFDTILRHQQGTGKKVIICGPKGITQQVYSKLKGYTWNLIEADAIQYEVREIIDNKTIEQSLLTPPHWSPQKLPKTDLKKLYQNDRFQVNFTILDHKIPSIAYQFQERDTVSINMSKSNFKGGPWVKSLKEAFLAQKEADIITIDKEQYTAKELFHLLAVKKGDTLGVIMDHAANEENHKSILSLFSDTNQVLIECFHLTKDLDLANKNYHSYSNASGEIMKKCKVKKAIPVHFSRRYTLEEIEILIAEFEAAFQGKNNSAIKK